MFNLKARSGRDGCGEGCLGSFEISRGLCFYTVFFVCKNTHNKLISRAHTENKVRSFQVILASGLGW